MLFSVVIPVFRDSTRLDKCLDALFKQDFPKNDFEVIVVNNDPDNLFFLDISLFKRLNLKLLDEPTPGSYAARNNGIKHATGNIIAFTDSDCIPDKDWLKNSKNYFERDIQKKIGILAGEVSLFYQNPQDLSNAEIYEKYTAFTQEKYASKGNCVTANWLSYRNVIEEFNGFNSKLKSNGDTELSKQISNKYEVIYAPDVIVRHPARYTTFDISLKYRRLLGGTYARRFINKHKKFLAYVINFSLRRIRFGIKKIVTVPPKESISIFFVCISLIIGAWKEFFLLIRGGETKR